jgi:hypothetical protein
LWKEVENVMGVSGEWRYSDGFIYPPVEAKENAA